jgi:hypothetical protein
VEIPRHVTRCNIADLGLASSKQLHAVWLLSNMRLMLQSTHS